MFAIVSVILSLMLPQQADSTGSGSLTIDGTPIALTHAVKTTRKNPFNDFFNDPVVILSDRPISEEEATSDAMLLARAQRGDAVILAVRFDGRPKRGQLFNVGIAHKALREIVLLPDVWFKYTFKAGAGTLTLAPREMSGHAYATDVKFSIPMPAEVTEEEKSAATIALPGPSRTDADRQRASQLLVDALQEGDEARALAIVPLGIDPNFKDPKMGIALINWAVLMCQPPVVAALVELKADLTHERLPGMTLLAEARAACPEAVGYLRAGGAQ